MSPCATECSVYICLCAWRLIPGIFYHLFSLNIFCSPACAYIIFPPKNLLHLHTYNTYIATNLGYIVINIILYYLIWKRDQCESVEHNFVRFFFLYFSLYYFFVCFVFDVILVNVKSLCESSLSIRLYFSLCTQIKLEWYILEMVAVGRRTANCANQKQQNGVKKKDNEKLVVVGENIRARASKAGKLTQNYSRKFIILCLPINTPYNNVILLYVIIIII